MILMIAILPNSNYILIQPDNLSLWVIGPELGKFIAGIRNDGSESCVYNNREPWRYASRAGIWKEDDKTLTVKCYSPEGTHIYNNY